MTPLRPSVHEAGIAPRLLAALGVARSALTRRADGVWIAPVDDVHRRYRDSLKAGAVPLRAPEPSRERSGTTAEIVMQRDGERVVVVER